MIIRDCPNALCRDPLYTGRCKDECIKRYEGKKDIKPTDLVEVVRCKDCKHWDEYHNGSLDGPGMGNGICIEDPHNWIDHRKADDFCSYGERKDDEC